MRHPRLFRSAVIATVILNSIALTGRSAEARVPSREEALAAMKRATSFMVEKVAVHGGYVWSYLPDLSRRWGEMEARPQMIWVQSPGTIQMGHVFLDAYHATGDEYYYGAARQVAGALMEGQLPCGGWHYLVDFAGEQDLREWYDTVGRNGWRLEEYQHYYGNATFDDSCTADATRYMLRFYLEKRDPKAKRSLDRAIQFVLDAQYPGGGWPQRFPPAGEFRRNGKPDYTGYITFNDNVTAGNVELLVQCHQALRDSRLPDAIRRGMDVFLATQGPAAQPAWSMQHSPDLKPAGARSYEPLALATHATAANVRSLLKFHQLTGDRKYLARIPEALAWLEKTRLPADLRAAHGGTHPTFVEIGTDRPLYIHRTGSNVVNGRYYADYNPERTVAHYSSFRYVDLRGLRREYERLAASSGETVSKDSPLLHPDASPVFPRFVARRELPVPEAVSGEPSSRAKSPARVTNDPVDRWMEPLSVSDTIGALDGEGRWLSELRMTSHPYTRDGSPNVTPGDYSRTRVGDETDTSPFPSPEPVMGISTATFVRNLSVLIEFVAPASPVKRQ